MKLFSSIRTKLTLWYASLVAATLGAFGASTYWFTRSTLHENLDLSLRTELKWVSEFIEPKAKKIPLRRSAVRELQRLRETQPEMDDELLPEEAEIDAIWNQIYQHTLLSPRKQLIQILDRNNDLLYASHSLGSERLWYDDIPYRSIKLVTMETNDGRHIRLAVSQNDFVKIFVAYPLEDLNQLMGNLFSVFLILAPLALLFSVVGGWFLAHQSLKPVDTLTKAARQITASNINQRLPAYEVDDEIGRLTATFNEMIGRLHAFITQLKQFSADASHELRTPLTIIRGEIEVALRSNQLSKPTRDLLKSVRDEVIRLSSIVESLMSLVRSEDGRLAFQFEPIPLSTLLGEVINDVRLLGESKNIKIYVRRLDPLILEGDRNRLRQLFLNILHNAVKYTPANGRIVISLEQSNGKAVVRIRDTGIGIQKQDLPKIFDRFYRAPSSKNDTTPGSGLGLSIAKWIVEAHHGTIEVQSKPKRGSTFTVTLPLAQSSSTQLA
jgi:two-component system OmpR family sensor kinase